MNTPAASKNIESIEEFTLFALDRSTEGLQQLADDSRRCAGLLKIRSPEAFGQLSTLAVNLRDFDVFEQDIGSLFEIDRSLFADGQGSLQSVEENFRAILDRLVTYLDQNHLDALVELLDVELPRVLDRFHSLLPLLRDSVDVQYIQSAH